MKRISLLKVITVFLLTGSLFTSCSKDDNPEIPSPSQRLASTAWQTTDARNEKGEKIALNDPDVIGFVGFSYFQTDGSFTIFSLDNTLKTRGTWSIPADGKYRTLVTPTFTRTVQIIVLNEREFTYRIYLSVTDKTKYLDIIHTPISLPQPPHLTPSEILSSTSWVTSGAKNEKGTKLSLTDPTVIGTVGFSTFNMNGSFTIFNLDDTLRASGTWSISADGRTRTLVTPTFTRTVDIIVLTKSEFTYRIYPITGSTTVYLDIIHTPVTNNTPQ